MRPESLYQRPIETLKRGSQAIIRGNEDYKKSRLHDRAGNFIGGKALVKDLPRSVLGSIQREVFHRYPEAPWSPRPLIEEYERIKKPDWKVLEVGAGMSTIWWSKRVEHVHGIEGNRDWYQKLQQEIERRNINNITLEFLENEDYFDLSKFDDESFNLVVADGHAREKVVAQAPRILKRPGYIMVGDVDKGAIWPDHYAEAVNEAVEIADNENGKVRVFTGLTPSTVSAGSDMLVYLPER